MYEIKIFENPDFGQVRTTTGENGAPFFCAVDVCRALGFGNSRDALRKHVMEDDVTKRDTIDSLGRKQQTSFINETNISLIETHHGTMERCTTKVTGKGQLYFVNGFVTGRFKTDNQSLGIPNYKFYKLSKLSKLSIV